ncbi:hypothetical protein J6590_048639 [Homalodisca vitripennis]|nr:hypothetical protein J6590_048639 [Homalodisca vitripennis]
MRRDLLTRSCQSTTVPSNIWWSSSPVLVYVVLIQHQGRVPLARPRRLAKHQTNLLQKPSCLVSHQENVVLPLEYSRKLEKMRPALRLPLWSLWLQGPRVSCRLPTAAGGLPRPGAGLRLVRFSNFSPKHGLDYLHRASRSYKATSVRRSFFYRRALDMSSINLFIGVYEAFGELLSRKIFGGFACMWRVHVEEAGDKLTMLDLDQQCTSGHKFREKRRPVSIVSSVICRCSARDTV